MSTNKAITWRPGSLRERFEAIQTVSKRTAASILTESVEEKLPELETRFAQELAALKSQPAAQEVGA